MSINLDSKYNRDAIDTMYREQGLSRAQARRAIFRREFKRQLESISAAKHENPSARVERLCELLLQAMGVDIL